jgi:hypothetical protein
MRQLKELTDLIIALDFVHPRKVSSVADEPKIIPSGREITIDTGLNAPGIILYRQTYIGMFFIDNYPFKKHAPEELFGQVCAYLLENGNGTQEIPEPKTGIDVLDNDTANIEFSIEFMQDVYAVEDPNGTIRLEGKRYRIADPEIDYALSGDVAT